MNYTYYLLSLERKFKEISSFIEISEDNFNTYSYEIVVAYLTACSEFEVVAKELCKALSPSKKAENISNVYDILAVHSPEIFSQRVKIGLYRLAEIAPFSDWEKDKSPDWWKYYNKVKHDRADYYKKGNLINLIKSLSALSIVNHYAIWKGKTRNKSKNSALWNLVAIPEIFRLSDVSYSGPILDNDFFDT